MRFIKNDVSQEDQVRKLFEDVGSEFGRLDMAVNNAGISNETKAVGDSDSAAFEAMLDTNVLGLSGCCRTRRLSSPAMC